MRIAAHIVSFEHDSRTAFAKAVAYLEGVADILLNNVEGILERSWPLIPISHRLGGTVMKKAT